MSDWPLSPQSHPPLAVVSTCSRHSMGSFGGSMGAPTTQSWPANNRALFVPFRLSAPFLVKRIFWLNGTASGNVDAGVYAPDGTRLFSIGSTAMVTNSVIQGVNLGTAYQLYGGLFYFALNCSTTGASFAGPPPSDLPISHAIGLYEVAVGAITLPATVTFATLSTAKCPWVGISQIASLP